MQTTEEEITKERVHENLRSSPNGFGKHGWTFFTKETLLNSTTEPPAYRMAIIIELAWVEVNRNDYRSDPLSMWKMIVLGGMSDMWYSQTSTIENWMKPNVTFYNMGTPNLFMYYMLWYLLQLHIYSRFPTHNFCSCKHAFSNTFSQSAYWAPFRVQFSTSLRVYNSITILLC